MTADITTTNVDGSSYPNFSGTWIANLTRSKFRGSTPKSLIAHITHVGDELRQELRITKPDGTEERANFQTRTSGQESRALLNDKSIRSNVRWNGQQLAIETWFQFGSREMHFCDYWSLSSDGHELTMQHRDDDLSGQLVIFERQT